MIIFDGRKIAADQGLNLKKKIEELESVASLCIFQVGEDPATKIFIDLKMRKAGELGVVAEHIKLKEGESKLLGELVKQRALDPQVGGIMIQLPAIGVDKKDLKKILELIPASKDADGLRQKSKMSPAVLRAVAIAVREYENQIGAIKTVAVVGAKGNLGEKLVEMFKKRNIEVIGLDQGDDMEKLKKADLVVLTTGVAGVVKEEMLSENTGMIDLGAPTGEFENQNLGKVSFLTPVPGGIGPVTVMALFENLVDLEFERRSAKI